MNSHEYAHKLKETADFLLSRPQFDTDGEQSIYLGNYWTDKEKFLTAVQALGPGTKKYDCGDLEFRASTPIPLWIRINRSAVCRKVQEEKWICEPLLSADEEELIGRAA